MASLGLWHGGRSGGSGWSSPFFHPFLQIWTPTKLAAAAVDTWVRREDVKVEVEDDVTLQISGERVVGKDEENDRWHRAERRVGSFSRRFRLPEDADVDGIRCGLEHGVLTVEVPRKDVQEQSKNVRCIDVA
ncbi:class I heat shock protein [Striga asiatica]|uniref:Class I heat shock protein n=1 Tax=Striga asiatica TaxID=4170 RepID=A0A5A7PTJ0_STRAF|nr:class I heat shock protein [Striga asiatica]